MKTLDYVITIAATFTAEPVATSIAFWMKKLDLPGRIVLSPFNQIFQQLLDPNSLFAKNSRGLNVILLRLEDWAHPGLTISQTALTQTAASFASTFQRDIETLVITLKSGTNRLVPCLLCICHPSPQTLANTPLATFLQRMEEYIAVELASIVGVYLVRPEDMFTLYPIDDYYEPLADKLGRIPYIPAFFTALGTMIARHMFILRHPPYKVIVLDCDETLWKGICGEVESPLDVEIDSSRRYLQEFMITQHNNGMLLCLCSKNNPEDVLGVFNKNPGMVLNLEHILTWRINWDAKSANLYSLAEELHLGLDSFIFLDDDPVMCSEVQINCPQVLVLQLPQEEASIPRFLQHTWAFDHLKVTDVDARRTLFYRQNLERERLQQESSSIADFLASLELQIEMIEVTSENLERVAQLTQRTNQFNMTTVRRTEKELENLLIAGVMKCRAVRMADRFGDYGLVGVLIFTIENDTLMIDTFLLSCRALGRRVEHQLLGWLGNVAQEHNLQRIKLPFLPTTKNQPALEFLNGLAIKRQSLEDGSFVFDLSGKLAAKVPYEQEQASQSESVNSQPNST